MNCARQFFFQVPGGHAADPLYEYKDPADCFQFAAPASSTTTVEEVSMSSVQTYVVFDISTHGAAAHRLAMTVPLKDPATWVTGDGTHASHRLPHCNTGKLTTISPNT